MSRIGRAPIIKPEGVMLSYKEPNLTIEGKLGSFNIDLPESLALSMNDDHVHILAKDKSKSALSFWGLYRSLINNAIIGVSEGFEKRLELVGVGYRASMEPGNILNLKLGYSHIIQYNVPKYVEVSCPKPTSIRVFGMSKQKVHQVAAEIRSFRKPEPYKGKGVRYYDEVILLKEGKRK